MNYKLKSPSAESGKTWRNFNMQNQVLTFDPANNQDGKTLLEQLEDQGIELNTQCRGGFCGACRVRLLEGTVQYNHEPLAALQDGEILPCSCQQASEIKISI